MNATLTDLAPRVVNIVRLIDAEFDEMPGMRLTDAQVRRLWHLSHAECSEALNHLCEAERLARDDAGRYLRRGCGY
jgi:hypothetical protein